MVRDAEGPVNFEKISYKEYLKFEGSYRDRIMEAFENGNNYNV
jgi:hypothetical protein